VLLVIFLNDSGLLDTDFNRAINAVCWQMGLLGDSKEIVSNLELCVLVFTFGSLHNLKIKVSWSLRTAK